MSDIWAPVIAALGSAVITAGAMFGIDQRRARRLERAGLQERRRHAYSRILTYSGLVTQTAAALQATIQFRSGLREGLDVTLRHRQPIDPMDIDTRLRQDFIPLSEAWSDVWTIGTPEAVVVTNRVVDQAATVLGIGTTAGDTRSWLGRFASQKWTDEQLHHWKGELETLDTARKDLTELARRELGIEAAQLLTGQPAPEAGP